jgi:hypothetical protein
MIREIALQVYAGPLEWGVRDCCTCPCDALVAMGGPDAMAPLRGRYSTGPEAVALIRSLGGWRRMTAWLADQAGLRAGVGAAGEIGLVRAPECTGTGYALALCLTPGRWAVKAGTGYTTVPRAVVSWAS